MQIIWTYGAINQDVQDGMFNVWNWSGQEAASAALVNGVPHFVAGSVYIPGGVAGAVFVPGFAKATVQQGEN